MFTVEQEPSHVEIITLDETNRFEDVEVTLDEDNVVWIRQYCEELGSFQLIYMSYQQLLDIKAALDCTHGAYIIRRA